MRPLHRLNPEHYQKQALAAHYLKRVAEFAKKSWDAEDSQDAVMWDIARGRQMAGARQALSECGCPPSHWTAEVRQLYPGTLGSRARA